MPSYITHQNAYVMNALNATGQIAEDARRVSGRKGGRVEYKAVYAPPAVPLDRTIKRGDVLFDLRTDVLFDRNARDQEPRLRSVLNGATVVDTGEDDAALKRKLEREIRVLGLSRKDVVYDVKRPGDEPSDQPVTVIAGLETTTNTGTETIRAGDAVEWYAVDPDTKHQVRDGVNIFSENRVVLGLRPMRVECSAGALCEDDAFFAKTLNYALSNMLEVAVGGAELSAVIAAMQKPLLEAYGNVAGVATTDAARGKRFDMMVTPFAKIRQLPPRSLAAAAAAAAAASAPGAKRTKMTTTTNTTTTTTVTMVSMATTPGSGAAMTTAPAAPFVAARYAPPPVPISVPGHAHKRGGGVFPISRVAQAVVSTSVSKESGMPVPSVHALSMYSPSDAGTDDDRSMNTDYHSVDIGTLNKNVWGTYTTLLKDSKRNKSTTTDLQSKLRESLSVVETQIKEKEAADIRKHGSAQPGHKASLHAVYEFLARAAVLQTHLETVVMLTDKSTADSCLSELETTTSNVCAQMEVPPREVINMIHTWVEDEKTKASGTGTAHSLAAIVSAGTTSTEGTESKKKPKKDKD